MKTLILLFLFCGTAGAQEKPNIDSILHQWREIKLTGMASFRKDNDRWTQWLTIEKILAYYEEYKDSCWADSTLRYEHEWVFDGRTWNDGETYWTHRFPDFPGFMEYLRKKGTK